MRELKFVTVPKCQHPLVETDNSLAYIEGVDGCGVPCNSPLYKKDEHEQVQRFTQTLVAMCLTTTLFAVVSLYYSLLCLSRSYFHYCFSVYFYYWLAIGVSVPGRHNFLYERVFRCCEHWLDCTIHSECQAGHYLSKRWDSPFIRTKVSPLNPAFPV